MPKKETPKGMLVTFGGRFGDYALYVDSEGYLVYCYNLADSDHYYIKSKDPLPTTGDVTLKMVYTPDSDAPEAGATVNLYLGEEDITEVDENGNPKNHIPQSLLSRFTIDETMDIGYDTGTPVNEDYTLPFDFNGTLNSLTIELP